MSLAGQSRDTETDLVPSYEEGRRGGTEGHRFDLHVKKEFPFRRSQWSNPWSVSVGSERMHVADVPFKLNVQSACLLMQDFPQQSDNDISLGKMFCSELDPDIVFNVMYVGV